MSISKVLNELKQRSVAPPSTDRFLEALRIMNEAAHGFDVDSTAVERAIAVGTVFLAELVKPAEIEALRGILANGRVRAGR